MLAKLKDPNVLGLLDVVYVVLGRCDEEKTPNCYCLKAPDGRIRHLDRENFKILKTLKYVK